MIEVSSNWPVLESLSWQLWLAIAMGVVVLLVLWRLLRSSKETSGHYDASKDRYAALSPINRDEVDMLHYLQQAFPDGAVLFRPRLVQVITVRKSAERQLAMRNLGQQRVDFLVCSMEGEACYAFDLDRGQYQNDRDVRQAAAQKRQMLRTAGIRLVHLRGSARRMPAAAELRARVMHDAPKPTVAGPSSGFGPSGFDTAAADLSSFGTSGPGHTGFGNSGFAPSAPARMPEQTLGVLGKRS